ncbi:MAG: VOC family protein [Deltaproteobacteria bacterium]|nr:VOC family protein [Deltaproteobacteria bacterium]
MAIELNHTIVPVRDKEESARFYETIFGFAHQEPMGHFQPIHLASQSLTLDLDNREVVEHHHYAFKVSEPEFDEIFGRIREAGLKYGSGPRSSADMEINTRNGGRGVYFRDPSGHLLELITRDYA